jgi:hypothetical protein
MAPRKQDDTTARLDAAAEDPGPMPWHERPAVLIASAFVVVGGLIALMVSVADVSAESTRAPATALSTSTSVAPAPRQTTESVVASPAPSPLPTEAPPSPTAGVPYFAAGPTAEMEVPPSPPAPAPFQLPPWLLQLLHPQGGSN